MPLELEVMQSAGQRQQLVAEAAAAVPEGSLEAGEREQGEAISKWAWYLHLVYVLQHIWFIATIIWTGWLEFKDPKKDSDDDPLAQVRRHKTIYTMLMAPLVIYQTAKHWLQGTYFPLTSSDSAFAVRFGRKVDRNPVAIRFGTLFSMFWLCTFLFVLSLLNFIELSREYCPFRKSDECHARFMALGRFNRGYIWVMYFVYLLAFLLKLKSFALAVSFVALSTFSVALAGVCTLGVLWVFLCISCARCDALTKDTKVGFCKCGCLYGIVAFFYRNL